MFFRCLLQKTFVERTFCVDTEGERKDWMEAIQSVADKIIQQDYKASSEFLPLATSSNSTACINQDPKAIKVCVLSRIHNYS